MNSKELMIKTLTGRKTGMIPVAPHWWGMYKFQLAGLAGDYSKDINAIASEKRLKLSDIDAYFYETFKPDWFHLGSAGGNTWDPYRQRKVDELKREVRKLESKTVIDEFVELSGAVRDEIKESGTYDHVRILAEKYGAEVFIALNEGNPICGILDPGGLLGFEEGLIALVEKQEMMGHLIFRQYEKMLERVEVLKEYGCHGYIGSETYCSPDLISPTTYKSLIYPAQKYFYKKVASMGIVPIVYFLGDVLPLIEYINTLGVSGLMVEESKKTFTLDVISIRKKLREDIALFGNLDSVHILLNGKREDVENETLRQLEAAKYGCFIMSNGSPIALNTPEENIRAMIKTARRMAAN